MIEPQEETALGWIRRTEAGGRISVTSTMTGIRYAMKVAGMALSYHQVGALIGVSGRQAARYAEMDRIPEWTAVEIDRLERMFLKMANDIATNAYDPFHFPGHVPAGMPETSFLACCWRADQILRAEDGEGLDIVRDASS